MWEQYQLRVSTDGRGTYELTPEIDARLRSGGVTTGLAHVFLHHTSASLIICENADPSVRGDLETYMADLVRDGDPRFAHTVEGPDDMSAHVRSVLTQSGLTVPVSQGRLALGTWQSIYLWEHRTHAHNRRLTLTVHGD